MVCWSKKKKNYCLTQPCRMLNKPLIFDSHLDLAMNSIEWNRKFRF